MLKPLRIINKFKKNHHCAWIDALKEGKTIITTRRSHSVNTVVLADFYLFRFLENWTTGRRQLGNSQEFPVYAAAVDSNRARKKKMIKSKSLFHTAELAIIIFFSAPNVQWYVFLKIHSKGFFPSWVWHILQSLRCTKIK